MTGSGVVHLICGPTGAGKTTYALKLAEAEGAVRFSVDEWMTALFWMDSPQPIDAAWSMERFERCAGLMWRTAMEVCRRGAPVVLEIGLVSAAARARYVGLAREAGLSARLHALDAPREERWRRVEVRNRDPDAHQLQFEVTREMFDFVEGLWEPPSEAELRSCDGVAIDSGRAQV